MHDNSTDLPSSLSNVSKPLSGLTVVELADSYAGSTVGRLLAELGAEVLRVQRDGREPDEIDRLALHRNKRLISHADLASFTDQDSGSPFGSAHVIIDDGDDDHADSSSSSSEESTGGGGAVRCRISGSGRSDVRCSPDDLVVQALSGCMDLTGHPGGPPAEMGIPLTDIAAGIYATIGVLGALCGRHTGPVAGGVEVAKLDAAISMLSYMAVGYFADGRYPSRVGTGHAGIVPYNAFRAKDDEVVVAPFTQRFWRNFCRAIDRSALADRDEYRDFAGRVKHKDDLMAELNPVMLRRTVADWLQTFTEYDVPAGPVLSLDAALALDQTLARDMVLDATLADGTTTRVVGSPFNFHGGTEFGNRLEPEHVGPVPALPLAGVRVLDLTRMFAGPCSTQVLADLGAEVIKVEEPRVGDPTRRNIPFWGGESAYFMSINRGKKSICIDLKSAQAKEDLLRLVPTADIVVENYRPGVMSRLGLDYDALRKHNPAVIMASLSGFGATGPMRKKISFDLVNQAMAGLIDLTGDPADRPVRIGVPVGDMAGGLYMAIGVLAGLFRRRATGQGCWLDLSLHDVLLDLLGPLAQGVLSTGQPVTRSGSRDRAAAPRGVFEARDGWLVLTATTDHAFKSLIGVLDLEDLAEDARFVNPAQRKLHEAELTTIMAAALSTRSAAHWAECLQLAGIPAAPVLSLRAAVESASAVDRALVYEAEHPTVGTVRNLASPLVLNGQRLGLGTVSPVLGQDTTGFLTDHQA